MRARMLLVAVASVMIAVAPTISCMAGVAGAVRGTANLVVNVVVAVFVSKNPPIYWFRLKGTDCLEGGRS